MTPRDPEEVHRAATPLELFFDLCFVVAIAQAAVAMHHALAHGHVQHAIVSYVLVFFCIWWAWMNFTWFASAYDTGDVPYRLKVFLQIAGVLVLAASVPRAFEHRKFEGVVTGFVIMRVGLIAMWVRAGRSDPPRRTTAFRYATGLGVLQLCWIGTLFMPGDLWYIAFIVFATLELLVPAWAERAALTPWHPHHIVERFGLLALIVMGESILATTIAVQGAFDHEGLSGELIALAVGSLLTVLALWWIYFGLPGHRALGTVRGAFAWGYSHVVIFGSIAAVGAGLALAADVLLGHSTLTGWAAGLTISIPASLFLLAISPVLLRPVLGTPRTLGVLCVAIPALLGVSAWHHAALGVGLVMAVTAVGICALSRHPEP